MALYSKYTRALTFENSYQDTRDLHLKLSATGGMQEYVRVREREAERKMMKRSHLLARVSDALLSMTKAVMHAVIIYHVCVCVCVCVCYLTAHGIRRAWARGKKSGG